MKSIHQITLSVLIFAFLAPASATELEGEQLHSKLVITAIEYDTFNQRCRGVSAAKNESKVNRLFIRKYGVTVNNYIKNYLSPDPRVTKSEVKGDMFKTIAEMGGCQQARQKGLEKELRYLFRKLSSQTEKSTWFPEVKNL